jgi:ubiquinol-cytochrome c reductase cytochrome b subunit
MNNQQRSASGGGVRESIFDWVDARTGIRVLALRVLEERIPGGARAAYVFGSGLLFIFLLQIVTGVSLALYYTPTADTAHTSVAYITKQVAGGAFLRSLHSYGSSAMIIVLGLHFLQTFLYGSFKGRRELLWLSGALLSLMILGMGFTGYLLPWDQKAYFATAVGTNVAGQVPLIGGMLTRFLRAGDTIGTLTLSRFYLAHVFLIPATIFLFIGAHVLLFRKAGPAGPIHEDPIAPRLPAETFYPRQVLFDMGFALLITAVLAGLSYFRPVTLGPIANPADSHFLPRPEWYYLPMFEWLKFWEGPGVVVGIVVVPGLVATAFFLMPFLDRSLERRPWRRPIPALAVSIVVLGMSWLGIKSHIDDAREPIAGELARQAQEEAAYSAEPFEPYVNAGGIAAEHAALARTADPLIAHGKAMFMERGCVGCHGSAGKGTSLAPSLVGVARKFTPDQIVALLHNPNTRMKTAGMPRVDAPAGEMSALLAYLGVLGTRDADVAPVFETASRTALAVGGPADADVLPTNSPHVVRAAAATTPGGDRNAVWTPVLAGRHVFQEHGCFACHGQEGMGAHAPALAPLIANISDAQLGQLLRDPNAKMRQGGMPPVEADPQEIIYLISYLRSLRPPARATQHAVANVASIPIAEAADAPVPSPAKQNSAQPITQATPQSQVRLVSASGPLNPAPAVSSAESEQTRAGRALFHALGCIGCHGVNAQGTAVAPSLIGVAGRYPGVKLSDLLHHPNRKMKAGGMPPITVGDAKIAELVAFLSSLGAPPEAHSVQSAHTEMATNLFSSAPLAQIGPTTPVASTPSSDAHPSVVDPIVARGEVVFRRNACATCHGAGGLYGTVAAPALAGTASLLTDSTLENLLQHHNSRMQRGGMPLTNFSPGDRRAIVAYIRSLPSPNAAIEMQENETTSSKKN